MCAYLAVDAPVLPLDLSARAAALSLRFCSCSAMILCMMGSVVPKVLGTGKYSYFEPPIRKRTLVMRCVPEEDASSVSLLPTLTAFAPVGTTNSNLGGMFLAEGPILFCGD